MHAACGGNPFLTGALLDELASAGHNVALPATAEAIAGLGPATISRAMLSRLSSRRSRSPAPPRCSACTRARGWPGRWPSSTTTSSSRAVDALVRANVLVGGVDGLTFVHPVIREATLAALGPLQEAAMHGRAVAELHARHSAAAPARAHLLARAGGHAPRRRRHPRPGRVGVAAAGDHEVAAACLERALTERPGDLALRERLGLTLLRSGRGEEAHDPAQGGGRGGDDVRRAPSCWPRPATATRPPDGARGRGRRARGGARRLARPSPTSRRGSCSRRALGVTRSFVPAQRRRRRTPAAVRRAWPATPPRSAPSWRCSPSGAATRRCTTRSPTTPAGPSPTAPSSTTPPARRRAGPAGCWR